MITCKGQSEYVAGDMQEALRLAQNRFWQFNIIIFPVVLICMQNGVAFLVVEVGQIILDGIVKNYGWPVTRATLRSAREKLDNCLAVDDIMMIYLVQSYEDLSLLDNVTCRQSVYIQHSDPSLQSNVPCTPVFAVDCMSEGYALDHEHPK